MVDPKTIAMLLMSLEGYSPQGLINKIALGYANGAFTVEDINDQLNYMVKRCSNNLVKYWFEVFTDAQDSWHSGFLGCGATIGNDLIDITADGIPCVGIAFYYCGGCRFACSGFMKVAVEDKPVRVGDRIQVKNDFSVEFRRA